MVRRARLATAIICYVLAMAMAALMVRSHWWSYGFPCQPISGVLIQPTVVAGVVEILWVRFEEPGTNVRRFASARFTAMEVLPMKRQSVREGGAWTSRTANGVTTRILRVPCWGLSFAFALCASSFANGRFAFSLRTVLIATAALSLLLAIQAILERAFD